MLSLVNGVGIPIGEKGYEELLGGCLEEGYLVGS